MSRTAYRISFADDASLGEAQDTLTLALIAAESLHGEAQVRLDASHHFDRDGRAFVIDASTQVGRDVARLFTHFLRREFGADSFAAERLTEELPVPASA